MLFTTFGITTFLLMTMAAPVPRQESGPSSNKKLVVAHHMVGNTFPYTSQDWTDDITQAHAAGIDGFALNLGRDDWQPARVSDAYEAAKQSGTDFKLFLSLDMSSLPCGSASDAQSLRSLVLSHADHPAQLLYNSQVFVSTFAGEACSFGSASPAEGWSSQFAKHPDLQGKIHFVPAFFVDPVKFGPGGEFADFLDGDFNWNSAWPIQLTTEFAASLLTNPSSPLAKAPQSGPNVPTVSGPTSISSSIGQLVSGNLASLLSMVQKAVGSTDTDTLHRNAMLGNKRDVQKTYMASVSPWFFTHYGADSFNKNFVFLSDEHLYSTRWESLIADRANVDIVEILTWNDFGESHYVGPIKGGQPFSDKEDNGNGGQGWAEGFDHQAWLKLTKYYAAAFKNSPPTGDATFPAIEKDEIVMWARQHPATAQASEDSIGPPTNFELFQDNAWVVVMATAPSTVFLSTAVDPPINAAPALSSSSSLASASTSASESTTTSDSSSSSPTPTFELTSSTNTATSISSSSQTSESTSSTSSTDAVSASSASIVTITITSDVPEPTTGIFRREDTSSSNSAQSTPDNKSSTRSFNVPAGITKLSIPLTVGGSMYARIERDGATVATVDGYVDPANEKKTTFTFNGSPKKYNFNALVLST